MKDIIYVNICLDITKIIYFKSIILLFLCCFYSYLSYLLFFCILNLLVNEYKNIKKKKETNLSFKGK